MNRFRKILPALVLATLAVAPCAAQNSNDDSPGAWHGLSYSSTGTLLVSYKQLTVAGGQTLRQLASGEAPERQVSFYNDRYIPFMLGGTLQLQTTCTLGTQSLPRGNYRFSFRVEPAQTDADGGSDAARWMLEIYSNTGKRNIGEGLMSIEKGWWEQEKKVMSVPLETADVSADKDADSASRLQVIPMAVPGRNDGSAHLHIAFGSLRAQLPIRLDLSAGPGRDLDQPVGDGEVKRKQR